MYSLVIVDNEEIKKAKPANKDVVKNKRHKEYIDVLFNKILIRYKKKRIQVNSIELELMMLVKFICLVLMIKGIFLMMVLLFWLIFIKM